MGYIPIYGKGPIVHGGGGLICNLYRHYLSNLHLAVILHNFNPGREEFHWTLDECALGWVFNSSASVGRFEPWLSSSSTSQIVWLIVCAKDTTTSCCASQNDEVGVELGGDSDDHRFQDSKPVAKGRDQSHRWRNIDSGIDVIQIQNINKNREISVQNKNERKHSSSLRQCRSWMEYFHKQHYYKWPAPGCAI